MSEPMRCRLPMRRVRACRTTTSAYVDASTGLSVTPATLTITASEPVEGLWDAGNLGSTGFTETGLVDRQWRCDLRGHAGEPRRGFDRKCRDLCAVGLERAGFGPVELQHHLRRRLDGLTVTPATLTITARTSPRSMERASIWERPVSPETGLVTANGDAISGVTLASLGAASTRKCRNLRALRLECAGLGPVELQHHLRRRLDGPQGHARDADDHGERPVQGLWDQPQSRRDRLHGNRPRHRQRRCDHERRAREHRRRLGRRRRDLCLVGLERAGRRAVELQHRLCRRPDWPDGDARLADDPRHQPEHDLWTARRRR